MAATDIKQIWFWGTTCPEPPPMRNAMMAASQGIIIPGSPVELSSGVCELSDTDDTMIYGFVVGVVDRTATWPITAQFAANAEVRVVIARAGDLYACYADSDGTDSAVAQTNVGEDYGITVGATSGSVGYTTMNVNETSNVLVRCVDLAYNRNPEKYALADNPGVAIVKICGTLQG